LLLPKWQVAAVLLGVAVLVLAQWVKQIAAMQHQEFAFLFGASTGMSQNRLLLSTLKFQLNGIASDVGIQQG
jgi:uncharacterized protein YfiM (DUF2279 family)